MGSSPPALRRQAANWVLAAAAALVAAGATWLWLSDGGTLAAIRRHGVVRIGYAVETPYALVDRDGRITGEAPETARLVAGRLGWRIEWVQTDFDALIPDLLDGRFDLVAAGLFVTAERQRLVRFATPELQVPGGLLVRRGDPEGPRTYAELGRRGVRTAVIAGSVEALQLTARGAAVVTVPDARSGVAAVESGLVAALALSWPSVRRMAADQPGLEAIHDAQGHAPFLVAAAFRPEDEALARAWSEAQAQVLGSPAHLRAIAPFGFGPADLPAAAVAPAGTGP